MAHKEENGKPVFKIILPYLLLFIAVVAVSFSAIIVVFLQSPEYNVRSEVIAMYRTLFAGVGALLLSIPQGKIKWVIKKPTLKKSYWFILAGLLLAIHFATWFVSLDYTSVAISTTLVDTVPIFLALFGFLFFKEKINYVGMIGIAIAVFGGTLLAFSSATGSSNQTNPILGIVFALVGALTVAFYFLIGKKVLQDAPLWPYFALVNLSSAFFLFIYCIITSPILEFELFIFPPLVFVLFILSAIGPSLVGHATYNYSLKKLPAFVVGVAILGEPIGATILGILFFNQFPQPISILYAIIILIGVVLTSISQNVKLPFIKKEEKLEESNSGDVQ